MAHSKSEQKYITELLKDAREMTSLTPHPTPIDAFIFGVASLLHLVRAFPVEAAPTSKVKAPRPAFKVERAPKTVEDPVQKARRTPRTPFLPTLQAAPAPKKPEPKKVRTKEPAKPKKPSRKR